MRPTTIKLIFGAVLISIGLSLGYARLSVNQFSGFGASITNNVDVRGWVERVRQAGGTLTNTEVVTGSNLISIMRGRSYWPKLLYLYPLLGDINAARCPIKYQGLAGTAAATNTNFTNSDVGYSTGLQGNGSNKFFTLGFTANQLGASKAGGFGYVENNINFTGTGSEPVGSYGFSETQRYSIDLRNTTKFASWGSPGNGGQLNTAAGNGDYYAQKTSSTDRQLYFNGSQIATNTTSDSASEQGDRQINLMAVNSASSLVWKGRCACAYFTDGTLTTQEVTDLHNDIVNYLLTPTGR